MVRQRARIGPPQRYLWNDLRKEPATSSATPEPPDRGLATTFRRLEQWKKTRQEQVQHSAGRGRLSFHGRVTLVSFRLEGMQVEEADVVEALMRSGVRGDLRSRPAQMIRNHVAILLHIELCLSRRVALQPATVLGWYASLCGGLPTTTLSAPTMLRLESVCRQVNFPPMRLHAALADIAGLHYRLLQDPIVPSFNGILSRLLLRYHLGRCELPQVLLNEQFDRPGSLDERKIYLRFASLLDERVQELRAAGA